MTFDAFFFTLSKDLQNYNTRSSTKIKIDYAKTNSYKYSIKYEESQICNNLPTAV